MKYYIYISDTKVDMLFPQVPHDIKKKVALEFKMDLKLLSASRKTETESEDNRIARLETVVDFIREYGRVGSVDEPDEYISDSMLMRWEDYGSPPDSGTIVYFGGMTNQTIVGLGGSMKHLLGSGAASSLLSHSLTPVLLAHLAKELQIRHPNGDEIAPWGGRMGSDVLHVRAVEVSTTGMLGPQQKVEFLAKKLLYWPTEGAFYIRPPHEIQNTLLATPLYVALAD